MPFVSATQHPQYSAAASPQRLSSTINAAGALLTDVYNRAISIGAGGSGGATLSMSGGAASLTYLSGAGTNTIVYTIGRSIAQGETGTHSYVNPGNGLEDALNLVDVTSYINASVVNNSTQTSGSNFTWGAATGASGYRIYYGDVASGVYTTFIDVGNVLSYPIASTPMATGGPWWARVRAYNDAAFDLGPVSNELNILNGVLQ